MDNKVQNLGMKTRLHTDFANAIAQVTAALQAEGFGVLTEIDVQTTLKKKLDVEVRPYTILGACNPQLAHRALLENAEVGLLLPCNVTVAVLEDETIEVAIIDPLLMLTTLPGSALQTIATEARERLTRVVEALAS